MFKIVSDFNVGNKTVIVRVDFNVPLSNHGVIEDDTRIRAALPTIKYLLKNKAKVVLMSHLGKVKQESDLQRLSLKPIAQKLSTFISDYKVGFCPRFEGDPFEQQVQNLVPQEVLVVENTRFADILNAEHGVDLTAKRESKNNQTLARYWASFADLFVNDAFGTCHRSHASNVGLATFAPASCLGFLVQHEIKMLAKITHNHNHPFVAILGGAKIADKIAVLNVLFQKADLVIIGGGMSYTFNKALGYQIGQSLFEQESFKYAQKYLSKYRQKILLPVDYAVSTKFGNCDQPVEYTVDANVSPGKMGLDIGPQTRTLFQQALSTAKTVFWNGPVGVCEFPSYATGTKCLLSTLAKCHHKHASFFSVIGGGDTAAAAFNLGFKGSDFSHVSTGGGATLTFLGQKPLPGITCINQISTKTC